MKTREEKIKAIIEGWVEDASMESLLEYATFSMERFYARCSDEEVDEYFEEARLATEREIKHEIKYGEDHED